MRAFLRIPMAISVVVGITDIVFRDNWRPLSPGCVVQRPAISPVISLVILLKRDKTVKV